MTAYSSPAEIDNFVAKLGERPLFVCDMDGNIMKGYSLVAGQTLPLNDGDNPDNQSIPFGASQEDLDRLVSEGVLKVGLFADKAMDARLPKDLVDMVNANTKNGMKYAVGFLTSRGAKDAVKLMRESEVEEPEQATLVADSGGALFFDGARHDVRKLSDEENQYILDINGLQDEFDGIVRHTVKGLGLDAEGIPGVFIEQKGTACNIHFRNVLGHFGEPEGSNLDQAIGGALKAKLADYADKGPDEDDGTKVFKVLGAPAAVEIKIAKVNKGHGLEAIAVEAMKLPEDKRPTAIIFSGDDVCKSDGGPGTDYYGMVRAQELQARFGIPFFNVHTHHPQGGNFDGTEPDPNKAPENLSEGYDVPEISLVLPRPDRLVDLILKTINASGWAKAA